MIEPIIYNTSIPKAAVQNSGYFRLKVHIHVYRYTPPPHKSPGKEGVGRHNPSHAKVPDFDVVICVKEDIQTSEIT